MKKIDIEILGEINGGGICDRLKRRYKRLDAKHGTNASPRRAKTYAKGLSNGCNMDGE